MGSPVGKQANIRGVNALANKKESAEIEEVPATLAAGPGSGAPGARFLLIGKTSKDGDWLPVSESVRATRADASADRGSEHVQAAILMIEGLS